MGCWFACGKCGQRGKFGKTGEAVGVGVGTGKGNSKCQSKRIVETTLYQTSLEFLPDFSVPETSEPMAFSPHRLVLKSTHLLGAWESDAVDEHSRSLTEASGTPTSKLVEKLRLSGEPLHANNSRQITMLFPEDPLIGFFFFF